MLWENTDFHLKKKKSTEIAILNGTSISRHRYEQIRCWNKYFFVAIHIKYSHWNSEMLPKSKHIIHSNRQTSQRSTCHKNTLNWTITWNELKWNDKKKNHPGNVYNKVCDMKWTAIPQLWCSMIVVSLSLSPSLHWFACNIFIIESISVTTIKFYLLLIVRSIAFEAQYC